MRILITGSDGFIAKNLIQYLSEKSNIELFKYNRLSSESELYNMLVQADWIIHLAGVNRPFDEQDFKENVSLTAKIVSFLKKNKKKTPIILSSSIQVEREQLNEYARSKLDAEDIVYNLYKDNDNPIYICRLANVFGKWSTPNYNSVVATFCHNLINNLPIKIHDSETVIRLVYIDDTIELFWSILQKKFEPNNRKFYVEPEYSITVGQLAEILKGFKQSRQRLLVDDVGVGLKRALYATYLSFLPKSDFNYELPKYKDYRGIFVEMLKTSSSGQFSYFTAYPGVTRGGHYHNSKNEKFLVIKGKALFKFKHVITGEQYQLEITGEQPQIVETVPGWSHDITNIGKDEIIVILWSNEIFDRDKPDTYMMSLT